MPILGLAADRYPTQPAHFDIERVIRPNILALHPYRCARDDYSEGILLDANENAVGPGLSIEHFSPQTNGIANNQVNGTTTAGTVQGVDLLGLNRYPDP